MSSSSIIFNVLNIHSLINKDFLLYQEGQHLDVSHLPNDILIVIFSMLSVKDLCSTVVLVQKKWRVLIDKEENLWRALCEKDFLYSNRFSKQKPKEKIQNTWKEIYQFLAKQTHIFNWPDGSIAEGKFKYGQLYTGTLLYADGTRAKGEFINHRLNGNGELIRPNGIIAVGNFKNHQLNGKGTLKESDGTRKIGYFRKDQLHGLGKVVYSDGRTDRGKFIQDELNSNINLKIRPLKGKKIRGYNGSFKLEKSKKQKQNELPLIPF